MPDQTIRTQGRDPGEDEGGRHTSSQLADMAAAASLQEQDVEGEGEGEGDSDDVTVTSSLAMAIAQPSPEDAGGQGQRQQPAILQRTAHPTTTARANSSSAGTSLREPEGRERDIVAAVSYTHLRAHET